MKRFGFLLLSLGVLCLLAPSTFAYTYPVADGQKVIVQDGTGPHPGGEFDIYDLSGGFLFPTFCVEKNEYFTPGSSYFVELADSAKGGGVGGAVGGEDPLNVETAWLFWHFAQGTLSNYDGSSAAAGALQNLIWYLEEEITTAPTTGSQGDTWLSAAVAATTGANPWTNSGRVKVMRLWTTYNGQNGFSGNAQDMLVSGVPEPATMLLLGSGLIGLAAAGRKRFRS